MNRRPLVFLISIALLIVLLLEREQLLVVQALSTNLSLKSNIVTVAVAAPTVQFSAATYSVNENAGSVLITIILSAASTQVISVHSATDGGTATADSDYETSSGIVGFQPGLTSNSFSISITDDNISEGNETFNLVLTSPSGAILGVPNTAVVTIIDDEQPAAFSCSNVTEIPKAECDALVSLYNSTNGSNWLDHTDWLVTNTPCSWYGVECANNHVITLGLAGDQLSGNIPPQLGNLTNLQILSLYSNQLSGIIPQELGSLKNLSLLSLSDNQLSGEIPANLSNLTNLQVFHMHGNQLGGSIPPQLGNQVNLQEIDLASNQLSGSIPPQLGNLAKLQKLGLGSNQLSGSIPPELGSLTNLIGINLSTNQLSGNIPLQLGNLINLDFLSIENNQLNGALPGSLVNLTKLVHFWFNNTNLCEPGDAAFQAWLAGITDLNRTSMPCGTNSAPAANNQSVTTAQNTAKSITLTASDGDNDPLTYLLVSNPSHGALSGAPPNPTYTPAAGFSGADSFTFQVSDGKATSNIATVSITVMPQTSCYTLTTSVSPGNRGTIVTTPAPNCQGNKYTQGTAMSLQVTANPGYVFGHWSGAANGNQNPLTLTMDGDKSIIANFDLAPPTNTPIPTATTAPPTTTPVPPINTPPVANNQNVTTAQNTATSIILSASDVENDALTYIVVSNPAHGALSGTLPNLTYTPNVGFSSSDSFTFKVNDGKADSNIATVNITVTPSQQTGSTIYLPLVMAPITPIIPDTTNVLTEATTQFLTSISDDGTFTFRQMTPELANVAPGEVIVGGVSGTAPSGFLRKVTTIANTGGQVIVQTVTANLEEAIEQGEVYVSSTLSPVDVQNTVLASGVTLSDQGKVLEIKDVVLYDADGSQKTTNDQVRANGSITLDSSFNFGLAIRNWKLERFHLTHTIKRTTKLNLEAKATTSLLKKKIEIAHYSFAPITVFVGVVPIVFTPILAVQVGADGSIYVGVSTGVTQQTTLTAGVRYENSAWNSLYEYTKDFQYNPPTLSSGLSLKGYAGAEFALKLYGVVGPHVDVNAYLTLEANPTATPWWQLYGGLEVPVGIEMTIFSHVVAGYQVTLIDYKVVIAQASTITRVSLASNGKEGNNASLFPSISGDGRYIAFDSSASNLVSEDTNGESDIFVYDQQTSQTSRVSVATNGTQGDNESGSPSISGDGRYVAFDSSASNLVGGDTNGESDVFVYDRANGQTSRVSVATNGAQGDNNESGSPSISADGRYVAFDSGASNLVSGDTNGVSDIFVHDRQTGQTSRVSVATNGIQADNRSYYASISGDGRYVAFESSAGNLVSGDTNGWDDIFVHDRQTGQTSRVSVATNGIQGDYLSAWPSISADGRYVAFLSRSSNLVSGDTNGASDIFVYDRQTGQTSRVSVATNGTQGNGFSDAFSSISADGRYVVFASAASNLVNGDTNGKNDLFIHDQQTGETSRVSVATDGAQGNNGSSLPALSGDGHYVVFTSAATNLVSGDTNGVPDVFLYDRGH